MKIRSCYCPPPWASLPVRAHIDYNITRLWQYFFMALPQRMCEPYHPNLSLWSACIALLSVSCMRQGKFLRHSFSFSVPTVWNSFTFFLLHVCFWSFQIQPKNPSLDISLRNISHNQEYCFAHCYVLRPCIKSMFAMVSFFCWLLCFLYSWLIVHFIIMCSVLSSNPHREIIIIISQKSPLSLKLSLGCMLIHHANS